MSNRMRIFYEHEINEISQHKFRLVLIIVLLIILLVIFILTDSNDESKEKLFNEDVKKSQIKTQMKESKVSEQIIYEIDDTEVQLTNPFQVDVIQTMPESEKKSDKVIFTPPNPPVLPQPQSVKTNNNILILKGTAISGDKKFAIIQFDKDKSTTKMLTIGDTINDKKVVDIGKNFIIFDNGEQLFFGEGQNK